jgi:hypothetical protein
MVKIQSLKSWPETMEIIGEELMPTGVVLLKTCALEASIFISGRINCI